ncbi:MAG TPA: amino acid adenylation domain-containing protein [Methylomirabilota bacterium]|nr:amino acid adenylation domain-containing protein [Methylomirabilota bacterium]
MPGDSGFADKNVRRPATDLLQRNTLKVVNMMDLARELSGVTEAPPPMEPPTEPAAFWRRRLANWRSATPLVATIPPQNIAARKPVLRSRTLDENSSDGLRVFADQIGVPFGVLFQATWALLLYRYSGEDDIVFGIVKGCMERDTADSEPGVHVVPSRVVFDSGTSIRQWLRLIAAQAREAAPFEFMSLDQIRAAADISTTQPMFESVISVGHDSFEPLSIATAQPQASQSQAGADTYPLVAAVHFAREICLRVAYSPQKFSEGAIKSLFDHWSTLLANLCERAEERVAAVPMLHALEREQLLCTWNNTQAPWPFASTVHQLFEQQVERTPDAPAVSFGKEKLSYRELIYRANEIANYLRTLGVGPDGVVGICCERSFDMVASVLGTLKAGAAYLPLDPTYPHERLRFMLEDSRAAVLLTHSKLRHVFSNITTPTLCLDADWPGGTRLNRENPTDIATPDNLSYLIYTSGSTGKPKGVAMIHRALVNLIDWQTKESRLGVGAKTLQFTSLSFDVSFQEMFSTWCSGGTLVLISAEMRLSPRELWNFIAREKIARIFLPFVALQQLADAAALEGTTADALREVVTAGEQLQVTPRLRELFARHPEATLHNHYGPSETHVVTALTLTGDPQLWPALPSIGRPIQNTQIYLLDQNHEPAAVGLPGELFIGGVALARGYFERAEVTAEKFISDPFADEVAVGQASAPVVPTGMAVPDTVTPVATGARLYKTGDLARYLPDGQIEFLGRIDHQVKVRGYRVELGEIEAALNKQKGVRESVVVARDSAGQKQLVAYVVLESGAEVTAPALRTPLKEQLPDYMVPALFVFLDKLPLTPSGKVDRKSLPAPEQVSTPVAATSPKQRPWLPIQCQLVQIWEELLGLSPVGIGDNFFELGGHSLLAVKMMDRVEELTGRKPPVTALFEDATITHLAELILHGDSPVPAPVIELQTSGDRLPVYFLHGDIIGGGFYARDISRLLGGNQPFYVLPPTEIADGVLPTVQEMAEQHLKDLRAHRPHGPYLLGGFCIGALVAYEMACRLDAAGEKVPFVALIDPQLPSALLRGTCLAVKKLARRRGLTVREKTRLFARGHRILYRLREEWNSPLREKARFAVGKARRLLTGASQFTAIPETASVNGVADSVDEQDILSKFHWIISSYNPPRYSGPVTIFLTDEQEAFAPFLERKWSKIAPRAEVHHIAGKHLGAITTNVEVLTGKLDECLGRINAR